MFVHRVRVWLPLVAVLAAGGVAVALLPRAGAPEGTGPENTPPAAILLSVGLVLTVCTVGALLFTLRSALRYPWKVVIVAAGYNALVVLVKFTLAPAGLYEINQTRSLSFEFDTGAEALGVALGVFALYFLVYSTIYELFRRRLRKRLSLPRRPGRLGGPGLVMAAGFGILVLATGSGAFAVLVLPLFFAVRGLEYVSFVFTSGLSLVVALSLVGAASLTAMAFHGAQEHAVLLRDAGVLTTLFWIGLALLAIYHVLWVVYILVLATLWPLRTVIPK